MARYPALFLALAFGGGILGQHFLQLPLSLSAISLLAATLSAFYTFTQTKTSSQTRIVNTLLLFAACSAGMLRATFAEAIPVHEVSRWAETEDEGEVLLLGEALEAPEQRRDYWRVPIAAHALQRSDTAITTLQGTVLASGKQLQSLAAGDQVILRGRLLLADEARNPGAFDYRAYLRANEIFALFYCSDSTPVWSQQPSKRWSLTRFSAGARAWLEKQMARFSNGQELALIKGLLLGNVAELDQEVIESFARTGMIHILSVSGLHVGFIALLLVIATGLLRVPKRWQWPMVIVALWFYAYLTGMKPPIVRATVMGSVLLVGRAFERETNLPNNLSVAALLILLWQPLQLFQLGFQLSFMAMFGLAYLYKPMHVLFSRLMPWRRQPLRWAIALLAVSFAAQLGTLPILVTAYGRLPITAMWGNLVVIPISFVTVATAAVACLFAPLSNFMLQTYGAVADLTATVMIVFTQWLATLPGAYVEGVHLAPLLVVFYLMALATFIVWRKRARGWLSLSALLVLNLYVWNEALNAEPRLRVTFFDVGQGDAALLEFPQEKRLLIDTGSWFGETSAGARVLAPYFHRQGIRRLHAVIISHPHADHLGGLPALLAAIKIDTVYHCGVNSHSELEQRCARLLDSLNVPHKALRAGARLVGFAGAEITALCTNAPGPDRMQYENLNEASLVMKIIFGRVALLFPGDAEQMSESHLLRHARALNSDLLKVAHHGSRTSSTEEFLQAVTPQWAVISAGRRNRFEHPHEEVLERYERLGISTVRTDQNGAVIFETEGISLKRLR